MTPDEYELPDDAIDLGNGAWYTKVQDSDGNWIGINEWHRHPVTHKICGGFVPFNPGRKPDWQVISFSPLTLSPSLQCVMPNCSHHGFIQEGRWVAA